MQNGLLDVLNSLPGIDPREVTVAELGGGLTNRVFLVSGAGRRLVVRLPADGRDSVAPGRSCEVAIMRAAAANGLAPEVVHADEATGVLVTGYIDGRAWRAADLCSGRNLRSLAALLRRVHGLARCGEHADLAGMALRYRQIIQQRQGELAFAADCCNIVNENAHPAEVVCCHNDIVAANVIDSGELKLVDWEYAADNDPMFDLASVIAYHDLNPDRQREILDAYTGGATAESRGRLAGQLRLFDALQWLWLSARELAAPRPGQRRRLDTLQQRIVAARLQAKA